MNGALWSKCVREARWLLVACILAVFAFCWVRVWMVSRIDTERFTAILDLLPGEWKKFTVVEMDWLITYAGRIALAFDEPIVVFGMSIWAIARGSDVVSGELNRGTLEMLLAQPVSRLQVLGHQAAVTLCGVVLIAAAAWLGTWSGIQTTSVKEQVKPSWSLPFGIPGVGKEIPRPWGPTETRYTPMSTKVSSEVFLPSAANLLSLGVFLAGVSSLVSACDRYRWRTIGIVVSGYVVQTILKLVGMASDDWRWLTYLSVFTPYEPEWGAQLAMESPDLAWSIVRYDSAGRWVGVGPLGDDLGLIAGGLLAYGLAAVIFQRRDLPAPL
ncbi:MAG: ABC transporter permease subunit [Pirellulales bacterium]